MKNIINFLICMIFLITIIPFASAVYPEPMYNSSYGTGFEGILNYANELTNQTMGIVFLIFIFIVTVYVTNKSMEVKPSGAAAFGFFICFIAAMIMNLFMQISEGLIFLLIIGLAGSILWSMLANSMKR